MFFALRDPISGQELDAKIEIDSTAVLLHSRGGATGGRPARNTDYSKAREVIFSRLLKPNSGKGSLMGDILIDSRRARAFAYEDRILLHASDAANLLTEELISVVGKLTREWGQASGAKGGNSTKALRIETTAPHSSAVLNALELSTSAMKSGGGKWVPSETTPPASDEDRRFIEGDKRMAGHFRTERRRNQSLRKAKIASVIDKFGRLVCERCEDDLTGKYPEEIAAACFDMHHSVPLSSIDEAREVSVEDLECLCCNCHRAIHKAMTLGMNLDEALKP